MHVPGWSISLISSRISGSSHAIRCLISYRIHTTITTTTTPTLLFQRCTHALRSEELQLCTLSPATFDVLLQIMKSNQPGKIQFINTVVPGAALSANEQRRAHSHAARTAHAKARRLCTLKYQAEKARQIAGEARGGTGQRIALRGGVKLTPNAVEEEQSALPSPLGLLASDRRDPFDSFVRPFHPTEYFLLDHCKSLHRFHW